MIIDESRDTVKNYLIGMIIANIIACIGLVCTVVFFAIHAWTVGTITYFVCCMIISINIACFIKLYSN